MKVKVLVLFRITLILGLLISTTEFPTEAYYSEGKVIKTESNISLPHVDFLTPESKELPDEAKNAIAIALAKWKYAPPSNGRFSVLSLRWETDWALATLTSADLLSLPVPGQETGVLNGKLASILLILDDNKWIAAVEGDPDVGNLLNLLPETELSYGAREAIFMIGGEKNSIAQAYTSYKFPWPSDRPWHNHGGWHGTSNLAIDFGVVDNTNSDVLSAAPGYITSLVQCSPSDHYIIRVTTENTSERLTYIHLRGDTVRAEGIKQGDYVSQGRKLGQMAGAFSGTDTCNIVSTGTHLHLEFPEKPFTIDGKTYIHTYWYDGVELYSTILNSVTLFSDTFSDGNLLGWVIVDAPGAQSGPSDWKVVSAKGSQVLLQDSNINTQAEPHEGTYAFTGNKDWGNYYLNVDVDPDDNDGVYVLFRYIDDDNYYRFFMDRERASRRLEKKVNGTFTTLVEDLIGYQNGWINLRIGVVEKNITVTIDNSLVFDVIDEDAFTSGMIGVGTWASTNCYFDNIIVSTSTLDPYADAVVDSYIKTSSNGHTDIMQALGRPNGSKEYNYVSVGGPDYWIDLDMGEEEEVVNGPGYDLRVYEIGSILGGVDEPFKVLARNLLDQDWVYLGQGYSTSNFDLNGSGLASARYIRILDISTKTSTSDYPGSDIDAVQNLNMAGNLLLSAPMHPLLTIIERDIKIGWSPVTNSTGYNIYFSREAGGVGYDLLASVPENVTSYRHLNAAAKDYTYAITAISPEGYESNFSAEVPYRTFVPHIKR